MPYFKLNGQPALDGAIDDGSAGWAPQQGFGNPAPEAPSSGSGPAAPSTVPGSLTFISDDGSAVPDSANAVASTQTVTFANSGLVFNNSYTGTVSAAYQSCVLSAEQALASICTNAVTINVEFDAQAEGRNGELASNEFWTVNESYASLKVALTSLSSAEPNNTVLQQGVAHLPSTDPSGSKGFELPLPYARMLGLSTSSQSPEDIVTLNSSYNWNYGQDVIDTLEHEISEGGMGRIGGLGDQNHFWSTMDLFRYIGAGQPDYTDGRDGLTTFFSYDGGATGSTLSFNNEYSGSTKVNGGDTADFTQQDVFGTGDPGETNTLSATDIQIMQALGWAPPPPPSTLISTDSNSYGSVDFTQVGNNYFLYAHGTTSGPELKYNGSPTVVGGPWAPIGAALTSSGYEIAWEDSATGQFTVWSADSSGNQFVDNIGTVAGNSTTLEGLEPSFNQDLNGDGIVGYATAFLIRTDSNAYGSVDFSQLGNHYFLYAHGTTTGPELTYNGSPTVAGAAAPWVPIAAALTATGYEVAYEDEATGQFTVWNADSTGNQTVDNIGVVARNSAALENLEPSFNQDLNGDGIIGVPPPGVISTDTNSVGSIDLTQVGNNYFLYAHGTTSGPELEYNGSPTVVGASGPWTPIGAALTSTGYEVAWKDAATNQFTVWNADSNGNQTVDNIGVVSGDSATLEGLEPSFNQDLNGDGFIGVHASGANIASEPSQTVSDASAADASGSAIVATADRWSETEASLGWLGSLNSSLDAWSQSGLGQTHDLSDFEFVGASGNDGTGSSMPQAPTPAFVSNATAPLFGGSSFGSAGAAGAMADTGGTFEQAASPVIAVDTLHHT